MTICRKEKGEVRTEIEEIEETPLSKTPRQRGREIFNGDSVRLGNRTYLRARSYLPHYCAPGVDVLTCHVRRVL